MYDKYFKEWEVRVGYFKEYVSLWAGWLGKENIHKLDEVTEEEWSRFNNWIRDIAKKYKIEYVDCESQSLSEVTDIEDFLTNYEESMDKESTAFLRLVLPEQGCVISEDWDYTYIIWHKNNGVIEQLAPLIEKAGLKHFHE